LFPDLSFAKLQPSRTIKLAKEWFDIGDIVVASHERLLVGNRSNKSVLLYDTSTGLRLTQEVLQGKPWEMCLYGHGMVAVAMGSMKEVQLFQMHNMSRKSYERETARLTREQTKEQLAQVIEGEGGVNDDQIAPLSMELAYEQLIHKYETMMHVMGRAGIIHNDERGPLKVMKQLMTYMYETMKQKNEMLMQAVERVRGRNKDNSTQLDMVPLYKQLMQAMTQTPAISEEDEIPKFYQQLFEQLERAIKHMCFLNEDGKEVVNIEMLYEQFVQSKGKVCDILELESTLMTIELLYEQMLPEYERIFSMYQEDMTIELSYKEIVLAFERVLSVHEVITELVQACERDQSKYQRMYEETHVRITPMKEKDLRKHRRLFQYTDLRDVLLKMSEKIKPWMQELVRRLNEGLRACLSMKLSYEHLLRAFERVLRMFEGGKAFLIMLEQTNAWMLQLKDAKITMEGVLDVAECVYGITSRGDHLVVSYNSYPWLEVISTEGRVIDQFCNPGTAEHFQYPDCLTTTDDGFIFVSDCKTNIVTKLDGRLNVLQIFNSPLLRYPRGITAASKNQLLVCSRKAQSIVLLRPSTGDMSSILGQKDGIILPWSLSKCFKEKYILVASMYTSEIQIYTIV